MNEKQIFEHLFEIARQSNDPEGVVSACIVLNGEIIVSSPSSDDSIFHAEYLVLKKLKELKIPVNEKMILYTTLEPCSDFPNINDGNDCTTCIINEGIKHVIYGASDPEFSTKAKTRFNESQIVLEQTKDDDIQLRSRELFNSTIKKDLSAMILGRKDKI